MNINFKTPAGRDAAIDAGLHPANAGNASVVDGLITATDIGKCIAQAALPLIPSITVPAIESLRSMIAQVYASPKWLPGLEQEEASLVLQLRKNLELSIRLAIANYANRDKLRKLLEVDCARIAALVIDEDKEPELSLIRKEAIIDFVLLRHSRMSDYIHPVSCFTASPNATLINRLINSMVLLQNVGLVRTEEELATAAKNKQADIAALTDRAIAQLVALDTAN